MEQSGITGSLLTALIRASIGGALFVAAVLWVCRALPRLPPSVRFTLYCLACVRMLAGIGFALPVPLAIADSTWGRALTTWHSPSPVVTRLLLGAPPTVATKPQPVAVVTPTVALAGASQAAVSDQKITETAPATGFHFRHIMLQAGIVMLWATGVLLTLVAAVCDGLRIRRILQNAIPITLDGDYCDIVRFLRLRRMPQVRCSADIATPMVSGIFWPTILVPVGFGNTLTQAEQRLAIAHELGHIRRHDLPLNLILALTRALFFFHPLAHLAIRECAAAREECCDDLAVRAAGATAAQYGRFLVGVASAHRASAQNQQVIGATALGMAAASFLPLRRRLAALSRHGARRAPAGVVCVVTAGAVAGSLPIQFVGAMAANAPADKADLPHYQLVDLGTLGGQSSDATGITDGGLIVGGSNFNPHAIWGHAYAIDAPGGAMRDLSALTHFRRGVAHGANDRGDVVFEAFTHPGRTSAMVYRKDVQSLAVIPTPQGLPYSRPLGINSHGDVVGASLSERPDLRGAIPTQAFVFRGGKLRQIGTLGGPYSQANAINDAGWVVGKADNTPDENGQSATRAFLARGDTLYDLGVLPGGTNSIANAVDSVGRIVGASDTADGIRHAFLVENGGTMRDLGALPNYPSSHALSVASNGLVVGLAYAGDGESTDSRRAVAWQLSGKAGAPAWMVDLNDRIAPNSGWTLETARAVNARGQIVGQGMYAGRRRAFLLNPVP